MPGSVGALAMMAASDSSARGWLTVGLLWIAACLNYLDRLVLLTMRSSITEAIPMTDAQFGLLTTVFLVSYGLFSPVGGFLADRMNRSRLIVISLLSWSIATWLSAHASTFGGLLGCRALMGVSEAAYFPAAGALILDYHRAGTRSLANGIHLSGALVGSGLGGLGGWLADRHDWTFVFQLFGLIGVVYAFGLLALLRDRPPEEAAARPVASAPQIRGLGAALAELLRNRDFILILLFWGLLGCASWAFVGWLPAYLQEEFRLTQGEAGLTAMGYNYSAALLGIVAGGLLADRRSRTRVRGRIQVATLGLLIAVPALLLVANARALPFALAGLVAYGFVRSFSDANTAPVLAQVIDSRHLATGLGVLNTFSTLVGGLSVYAGGVLRDARVDISTLFNFGALGLLGCAALLWSVRPREQPSPSSP